MIFISMTQVLLFDMHRKALLLALIGLMFSFIGLQLPPLGYAQLQPIATSASGKDLVSVNATVTLDVGNDTYKTRTGILTSAVVNFLKSGPNILTMSGSINTVVKTQIVNQINNSTQSLEGTEATNAIVGVEIGGAIKSLISSLDKPNQTAIVSIDIFTKCAPLGSSANCFNNIMIK